MKKKLLFALCICILLFGCSVGSSNEEDNSKQSSFKATILEMNENSVLVEPLEGEEVLKTADQISVSVTETDFPDNLAEGNVVEIIYSGEIMESYPAQIASVISINLIVQSVDGDEKQSQYEEEINGFLGVSMEIIEATKTSAKVEIRNTTDLEVIFGEDYDLQVLENEEWVSLPYLIDDWGFHSIGYEAPKEEAAIWEVDWTVFHGELSPGTYRIVKSVMDFRGSGDYTNYQLACEFTITA